MTDARSTLILPLILLSLCGCVTRTVVDPKGCVRSAPLSPRQQVTAPDPLLFRRCWDETKLAAKMGRTSDPASTPSCEQLRLWTSSIESASAVSE